MSPTRSTCPPTRARSSRRSFKGGPADQAGIHGATGQATIQGQSFPVGGDIIVAIDGNDVSSMEDVIKAVGSHNPGDQITVTILRGDNRQDVSVDLGTRPAKIQGSSSPTQP